MLLAEALVLGFSLLVVITGQCLVSVSVCPVHVLAFKRIDLQTSSNIVCTCHGTTLECLSQIRIAMSQNYD